MKEYDWSLETALKHVKDHRNRIKPNKGFMEQLKVYQGMLDARFVIDQRGNFTIMLQSNPLYICVCLNIYLSMLNKLEGITYP